MAYIVVVERTENGETKTERIKTDVSDGGNAVAQAKMRNQGSGYDWDNATVEKE